MGDIGLVGIGIIVLIVLVFGFGGTMAFLTGRRRKRERDTADVA